VPVWLHFWQTVVLQSSVLSFHLNRSAEVSKMMALRC